jgi:uncharacterized protein DUF4154
VESLESRSQIARYRAWRFSSHPSGRTGGQCCELTLLATLLLISCSSLRAAQAPSEYQVKAAYIFNFLKFVEWPEDPFPDARGKWVVGYVGDGPVGEELARLFNGKEVLGRTLQVKKFQITGALRDCNILFIGQSEKKRLPTILPALSGSSVLTVGDMEDFVGSGGMIQLFVEDTRVRMAIDVSATSRARLKISSKMLLLAHVVGAAERGANN